MITPSEIKNTIKELCLEANTQVRADIVEGLKQSLETEDKSNARFALESLIKNAQIARDEKKPFCQDTGYVTVFIQWGSQVPLISSLEDICNQGINEAYSVGYFRKSMVSDPLFDRKNTGDNTPGIVDVEIVEGSEVNINVIIKGAGSDNASAIKMFNPTDGHETIKDYVVELVKEKGPRCCPPLIIAVAIGPSFDKVASLSKKLFLRKIGQRNSDKRIANFEVDLLKKINNLGIGASGFGGKITALDVFVDQAPTHMACMPVAVNIGCHAIRTASKKVSSKI